MFKHFPTHMSIALQINSEHIPQHSNNTSTSKLQAIRTQNICANSTHEARGRDAPPPSPRSLKRSLQMRAGRAESPERRLRAAMAAQAEAPLSGEEAYFDLAVTARGSYTAYDVGLNGLNGRFAQINVAANTDVDLRVRVYPSCCTTGNCRLCDRASTAAARDASRQRTRAGRVAAAAARATRRWLQW